MNDPRNALKHLILSSLPQGSWKLWLFGSRAKSSEKYGSDRDVVIEGEQTIDLRTMRRVRNTLEDNFPYAVDVLDIHSVSDGFRRIVDAEKVAL